MAKTVITNINYQFDNGMDKDSTGAIVTTVRNGDPKNTFNGSIQLTADEANSTTKSITQTAIEHEIAMLQDDLAELTGATTTTTAAPTITTTTQS
jgi:hypothetical protein